jgi:hypothetical protein
MMTDNPAPKSTTSLMGRAFPADDTRTTLIMLLLLIAAAYLLKILMAVLLNNVRGQLGELAGILCLFSCLMGIGLIVFMVWLVGAFIRRDQYAAPLFILITGMMFVVIAPLPPLPQPVFPEEPFFAEHRADFEAVVALARQDKLDCVKSGCNYSGRDLPSLYGSLSKDGIVEVGYDPALLTVTFRPIDSLFPVIYFENADPRNSSFDRICSLEARFTKQLDEHWYLCAEDWD